MAFLPAAPTPSLPEVEAPNVPLQPNLYLKDLPPSVIATATTTPPRKIGWDTNVQRAEQAYERGKRLYQANDIDGARKEFDNAVDWMLKASAQTPSDREALDSRLDEMVDSIHKFDLEGMGASADSQTTTEEGQFEKAPLEDILQMTFPVDPKLKDQVLDQVKATVSKLPLSVNDAVLGYINYFAKNGHSTIVGGTERSGRYRSMILRILDEEGVPQELLHLAQAESGFIPRAVSTAAAGGMWQFLTWRGQQYGLKQTPYTDDRMDPEKATRAAAHHLHDLYSEFGDWYLAIAAYNCGPGVVEKAVERTGYADFWELRNRGVLPAETTNYVPIILAMTIMDKNAKAYGLDGLTLDPPIEYDTIETPAPTSLSLVADITGAPLSDLESLNPAVLRGIAPEHYPIHVPKGSGNQLIAALNLVPPSHCDTWRMHTVAAGETLVVIAKRYGVAASSIVAANNLNSTEPQPGDRLMIPLAARPDPPRATAPHSAAGHRGTTQHPTRTVASGASRNAVHTAATNRRTTPHAATVRTHVATTKAPARRNTASVKPPQQKASVLIAGVSNR
ncbi:MAG TPA: transglycosylase SLT domain-containing protein [Bryobacteraceae bacterium]|nr:transglycosylase SLT domain-containing protein [Bryobacteraceae bacterium]